MEHIEALKELRDNKELVITRADKSNAVVLIMFYLPAHETWAAAYNNRNGNECIKRGEPYEYNKERGANCPGLRP